MKKHIDMTQDDYAALMENDAPAAKDTILTGIDKKFSPETSKSLASLDGGKGGEKFTVTDNNPKDTMPTPSVQSLDDPARKATVKGNRKKGAVEQPKAPKKDTSKDSKSSAPKAKEVDESLLSFEEALAIEECDCEDGDKKETVREDETGNSEVAMTKAFFKKLVTAVSAANLDDAKMDRLFDGMASAGSDSALDVSDIQSVMSALRGTDTSVPSDDGVDTDDTDIGADDADMDADDDDDDDFVDTSDDVDDEDDGDGEPADPEDGEEHEGKTKLMDRKGKVTERARTDKKSKDKPKNRKGNVHESVREANPQRDSKRQALREFWMASIGHCGVPADKPENFDDLSDDELELLDIKRLSGIR